MRKPDLHDVGGDDCFVVFAASDFAEVEEVADDSDKKPVLLLLHHAATDAADGPAQRVEACPWPVLCAQLRNGDHVAQHECCESELCGRHVCRLQRFHLAGTSAAVSDIMNCTSHMQSVHKILRMAKLNRHASAGDVRRRS